MRPPACAWAATRMTRFLRRAGETISVLDVKRGAGTCVPRRAALACTRARRVCESSQLTFRVLAVLWIVWAYTPDWVLKSLGITYYPDRYWAIALPMYAMSLVVYLVIIYNAWNLCNTNPFESYYTVRGTCWRLVDRKT